MGTAIGDLLDKKEITLDYLSGKTVGVDSFNILYQFLSVIRGADGQPLMDNNGNITSHLTGLLYRTANLIERGVRPVFVFDGKPSKLKGETREKRSAIRTKAFKDLEKARKEKDLEGIRKAAQQAVKLDKEMIEEAKKLVELMGLPVIQAPGEGEAQVSLMTKKGDLYGCISQDFDSLLFGTPILLRNIAVSGKRKLPNRNVYYEVKPEEISLKKTLESLGITREKLIWIGMLVGTDFNEKIPKVGPKTAIKLVKEFDDFEKILEELKAEVNYDYREIMELFLKPKFNEDYKIEFKGIEKEKITKFLCDEHDFSLDRVENTLNKIIKSREENEKQSSLKKWF
ncbi:MAG: flap endonuclease-1 [archaeon]